MYVKKAFALVNFDSHRLISEIFFNIKRMLEINENGPQAKLSILHIIWNHLAKSFY